MAKKKVEVIEKEKAKQVLTPYELLAIEKEAFKQERKAMEIEVAQVRVDRSEKELHLLSANYTLKSKEKVELGNRVNILQAELAELKKEQKKLVNEFSEIYNLPDKWRYDPDSGEIDY